LTLYCLPFILFGVWVIIYRIVTDVYFTHYIIRNGVAGFEAKLDITCIIFMEIHRILTPMRGFANCLVYVIVSRWFSRKLKKWCCSCCNKNENYGQNFDQQQQQQQHNSGYYQQQQQHQHYNSSTVSHFTGRPHNQHHNDHGSEEYAPLMQSPSKSRK